MNKKVLCLSLLFSKTGLTTDILDFLLASKVVTQDEVKSLRLESDIPLALHIMLERLKSQDKLMLLDYEWKILPKEYVKLTLITEYAQKEFVYSP
jgi:hypothetical protein